MKPLRGNTLAPRHLDPGEAEETSGTPKSSPFFSTTWSCLGAAPRPGQARPRCCCRAHTRSLQLPSSARDRRPPMQKRISKRKSNSPRKKAWVCFCLRDFFSPARLGQGLSPRPLLRQGDRRLRERAPGGAPTLAASRSRAPRQGLLHTGSAAVRPCCAAAALGAAPPPSPFVELQPWRRPSEPRGYWQGAPPRPVRKSTDWSKQELQQVTVRTSLSSSPCFLRSAKM